MRLGYARIAEQDDPQALIEQEVALRASGCETVFLDSSDEVRRRRNGFTSLDERIQAGGTVVVTSLDRLGCAPSETMRILLELDKRGVAVEALDLGLDTHSRDGRLVLDAIDALSHRPEVNLEARRRRMTENTDRNGRQVGRPPALDTSAREAAISYLRGGLPVVDIARLLAVSRATIQRLKRAEGLTEDRTLTTAEKNRGPTMTKTESRMIQLAREAAAQVAVGEVSLARVPTERTVEDSARTVFRLGELFSGPGGIGVGAASAAIDDPRYRFQHQWANDYDYDTCRTYARNVMGDIDSPAVVHGDVRTLDFDRLKEIGDIDGLAFGFPCNDFSVVGERKGFDGTYGPLYTYGIKALEMFRPAFFLAENVGGLTSNAGGQALKQILIDMRVSGYRLVPHLYKFERYGVPQARHRIIIIGIRDDLDVEFAVPSPEPYARLDVSTRAALTQPPIPAWATNQEYTRQSATVVERLKLIGEGQSAFTADLPEELQIKTATKISQIYKRLDSTKPSYTITGSGGGGTHVYHWEEPRALTNRERARLQTFPDDFVFEGSKESVRKQIGMAVPARGAQVIFEAIMKSFAGERYAAVESSFPRIN